MPAGVYIFANRQTSKVYVGSAVDVFKRRREHLVDLNNGEHHSPKFQNSWNKHGSTVWDWFLLEQCSKEILLVREQHWIDVFNSYAEGYNSCPVAGHPGGKPHTADSKKKISEAAKIQAAKKGKTYAELYDVETAARMRAAVTEANRRRYAGN